MNKHRWQHIISEARSNKQLCGALAGFLADNGVVLETEEITDSGRVYAVRGGESSTTEMRTYRTIGESWLNTCQAAIRTGRRYTIQRGSYVGQRRAQLDQLAFVVTRPGERPLGVEYGGVPISDDKSIRRYFEDYLISPSVSAQEQYTYGQRIAAQLEDIAVMLHKSPETNQASVSVARPSDIKLADPPCLRELSWKSTDNGLQLTSFWRSWDIYGALALNLGGLQLLNEAVAEWAGLTIGPLVCYSDGAHIYEQSWGVAPK